MTAGGSRVRVAAADLHGSVDTTLTCKELVHLVSKHLNLIVSRQLVASIIAAVGFSRKKVRPKASRRSPELAQDFSRQLLSLQGREIVSVDESGFDGKPRPQSHCPIPTRQRP
jgi:hypothetical protein